MSQIKKALERARAERAGCAPFEGIPREEDISQAEDAPVENGHAQTCVVDIPVAELLKNRIVTIKEEDPATDQFKLLRTHLFRITRTKKWNTIQVSGFGTEEGKSMVAANLAVSIARDARQTTLLVDLDFRHPSLHRLFGLGEDVPGLKSYFLEDAPLHSLFVNPGIKKLSVLTTGGRVPHATELLGSPKMEAMIRELKQRYDDRYIVIDTPGINACPDPLVISEYVDAVLLVAKVDVTTQRGIKSAMDRLPKEKILGLVLNGVSRDEISHYDK